MHGSSSKKRHFVWSRGKDILKLNNTINKLNIILYYSLSLNTCEYLICPIYQKNFNQAFKSFF